MDPKQVTFWAKNIVFWWCCNSKHLLQKYAKKLALHTRCASKYTNHSVLSGGSNQLSPGTSLDKAMWFSWRNFTFGRMPLWHLDGEIWVTHFAAQIFTKFLQFVWKRKWGFDDLNGWQMWFGLFGNPTILFERGPKFGMGEPESTDRSLIRIASGDRAVPFLWWNAARLLSHACVQAV